MIYVSEALHRAALTHLQQRLDKDWSLCDAVRAVRGSPDPALAQHGMQDALSTDHHFDQAGFVRLLKP